MLPAHLEQLPGGLRARLLERYKRFAEEHGEPPEALASSLPKVWAASPFVERLCLRDPGLLNDLWSSFVRVYEPGELEGHLSVCAAQSPDIQALMRNLRRQRNREMARIAWRDLAGWASLDETLDDLTRLAEAAIGSALAWLDKNLGERHGRPHKADGRPQSLAVFGMGKLGGGELNYSSDVDLVFAFETDGQTSGPASVSFDEYFNRLVRSLIRVLSERTEDGFVFRVDTLLRPFGKSGALASSFAAMEQYYQAHGREWERYALIKARPVAGDLEGGEQLLQTLKPFIYRRYLDYSAFQSLRDMKALIEEQESRNGSRDNIKLGRGGIREIEFIVQVYQLIRGGQEPGLQSRRLRPVLARLGRENHLPEYAVRDLDEAYVFLRQAENRLQAHSDEQVHELPTSEDGRAALALAMDADGWDGFLKKLNHHRGKVRQHFERVFAAPQAGESASGTRENLAALLGDDIPQERALQMLEAHGLADRKSAEVFLRHLRQTPLAKGLSEQGRRWLGQLLPLLLGVVASQDAAGPVLLRVWQVIEAIGRRITYLALLVENPTALSQLVLLCAASPWITRELARHPVLLDELLDPRALYTPPRRAALEQELREQSEVLPPDDLDGQMNLLRRFRQVNMLRVAAADVGGSVPLMVVSDHLTEIAEVLLQQALRLAWGQMTQRHGRPLRGNGTEIAGFAVIGYGKLGGLELGYGSDIDLVFVHDGEDGQVTDGERPLDHASFFTRLGQKIIHIIATQTPAGIAYEVDLQLRPSGQSGLLVTSLEAFSEYQLQHAWTWEHQALVRARAVAGDGCLQERFAILRRKILTQPRNPDALLTDIIAMRQRMRGSLGTREAGRFDLKHGAGGITDIEFIVQYCVLRWADRFPALARWTDNIRQLDALAATGQLRTEDAHFLADAYRSYRRRLHQLKLQEIEGVVADNELLTERAGVRRIWEQLFGAQTDPS